MKNHINKKKLNLALISALGLASTAHAVDISSYIPSAQEEYYVEHQANLWFVLDDSGSMSQLVNHSSGYLKYNLGFMRYDPTITYVLPKRLDGRTMPLPRYSTNFWKKPFRDDASGATSWGYFHTRYYTNSSKMTCRGAVDMNNCAIWANYYRTKLLTLKSSLSLVLFSDANEENIKNLRIGYRSLHNNSPTAENIVPVLPLYGDDGDANKSKFKRWLYGMWAEKSTPLRGKAAGLFNDVVRASNQSKKILDDNPFLEKPGEAFDKETNKLLTCRRNYSVLLTDGGWNSTLESEVTAYMSSPGYIKSARLSQSDTFIDGQGYAPMAPYRNNVTGTPNARTLADIAFAAWKTDLDNVADNNNFELKANKIGGTIQQYNGSQYWHPYNDPADWQHMNTYTIGFGLNNWNNIDVNPNDTLPAGAPQPIDRFLDASWTWGVYVSGGRAASAGSTVTDLANAAVAGRGSFYAVQTPSDMAAAFDSILKATNAPVEKPTVTGSSGVVGDSQQVGGNVYTTKYDSANGTGSLMKIRIYDGQDAAGCFTTTAPADQEIGMLCDKVVWDAGKKLTASPLTSRNIFTSKRMKGNTNITPTTLSLNSLNIGELKYKASNLKFNKLSPLQKKEMISNFTDPLINNFANNAKRLKKLLKYAKGHNNHEANKFRSRADFEYRGGSTGRNILGSIVRTKPLYAGVPEAYTKHLGRTSSAYNNYVAMISAYTANNTNAEKEVVYAGSNDGMLHAFKANTGKELFAYMPPSVLRKLPKTVDSEVNVSLLDGNMSLRSVNFGSNTTDDGQNSAWRRMLVGGFGAGAHGVYSLNVTRPNKSAIMSTTEGLWDYSDLESVLYQKKKNSITDPALVAGIKSNVGNVMASPAIMQLQDNTWVAMFGNGYNSESRKAVVIIVNLKTGEPIQELELDGDLTKENGLGPVTLIPYPGKPADKQHQADRAYAGDLQGNLWVFDLEGSNKNDGIKLAGTGGKPLFTAKDSDGKIQPITVNPAAITHPLGYGNLIHFGTGSLFTRDDESSRVGNSVYAIWDDWITQDNGGLVSPKTSTVVNGDLFEVFLKSRTITVDGEPLITRMLDTTQYNPGDLNWALQSATGHRGWRIDLESGERAWQEPQILTGARGSRAVSYSTANYHLDDSGMASADGHVSCKSDKQDVKGSQLVFNMENAGKKLSGFGVLDVDKNGKLGAGDTAATGGVPITGKSTLGHITYNSISATLAQKNSDGTTKNGNCKVITRKTPDDSEGIETTDVTVCSSFSSWKELK